MESEILDKPFGIKLNLDKDFVNCFKYCCRKYGETFKILNGVADSQLNYTDFIDNFVKDDTIADVSIDGNANVGHKDVVTLMNEMSKPHSKLLAFNKIFYELKKKYGLQTARDWMEAEWNGKYYLHDFFSSTFVPYCYKGDERLNVCYKGNRLNVSFKQLYELVSSSEKASFDVMLNQEVFYPTDLYVEDIVNNEVVYSTKIERLLKHKNNVPMRFIKLGNGLSQIVTENHPVITSRGDINAKDIVIGDVIKSVGKRDLFDNKIQSIVFKTKTQGFKKENIEETLSLNKEIGWLVGMFLAEGSASRGHVVISQKLNSLYANKFIQLCDKYNFKYSLRPLDNKIDLKKSPLKDWLYKEFAGKNSFTKELSAEYIHYSTDFLDGILAGIIDGDGTIDGEYKTHCQIRTVSETLCHQLHIYLTSKGLIASDRIPYVQSKNKVGFKSNSIIYGLGFSVNDEYYKTIGSIKINTQSYTPSIKYNSANKKYEFYYGDNKVIENKDLGNICEEVYDITTSTGHFVCNSILSHNCYAYDLERLAKEGLYFIDTFNSLPPKHLLTYVDFVGEFVSYACNRSSGAVGLPSFLVYAYYFWKKDIDNNYLGLSWENKDACNKYAEQAFQVIIYRLNQPFLRSGIQSAFTNFSIFDNSYFEALFGGKQFPDGSFMIDIEDDFMEFQKLFMKVCSNIRSINLMTFPVLTISLLKNKDTGKFINEDFAKWACKHNMKWGDSNFYISSDVTSLSNCCRLVSNIKDLGFCFSIGGTALEVGSVKVSTINLARISYETTTKEDYIKQLKTEVILDCKLLDVIRNIIKRNIEKGLLPNYTHGLIHLENQYNTIGIIGVYETFQKFGLTYKDKLGNTSYTEEGLEFAKEILKTINDTKEEFRKENNCDYMINVEQIPGERAAAILQEKDQQLYPEFFYDYLFEFNGQTYQINDKDTVIAFNGNNKCEMTFKEAKDNDYDIDFDSIERHKKRNLVIGIKKN